MQYTLTNVCNAHYYVNVTESSDCEKCLFIFQNGEKLFNLLRKSYGCHITVLREIHFALRTEYSIAQSKLTRLTKLMAELELAYKSFNEISK